LQSEVMQNSAAIDAGKDIIEIQSSHEQSKSILIQS